MTVTSCRRSGPHRLLPDVARAHASLPLGRHFATGQVDGVPDWAALVASWDTDQSGELELTELVQGLRGELKVETTRHTDQRDRTM
jgi:hypothetical protein